MYHPKEIFLRFSFIRLLQQVSPDTPPAWGKMNFQQMVEHFSDSIRMASGRDHFDQVLTPPEKLPRMREFMLSDKPFKEDTRNPLMAVEAAPLKFHTVTAAIGALHEEVIYFFERFEAEPGLKTLNPFFGDLDFEQNIHLLHKHALHHLRQFGVRV